MEPLLSKTREGEQTLRIAVFVGYENGDEEPLIADAFRLTSDDHVYEAAQELRAIADRLTTAR